MPSSASNLEQANPLKIGLALMAAIALAATIYFFRHDTRAIVVIVAGAGVVMLVLLAYGAVLRWSRRRRSTPLERAIVQNTAALPRTISEPARRAALDDLRKKFETGLAKFRAAGKDLYSLPWYLLVGEPGSGKTEAIRRCNVGFPPGLQDGAQGAGGTINMNWWFTNHAVVLDTAGRLVFQEAATGRGGEWDQFLQLLAKARSACPVNGLLLVLPADSLITDSADQIEPKATHIAQQLDHIQRSLGVRFPVFVVVTKCDLINGFREFFENLTDPQLQHQMLGWSNPEPRDEPFHPELLDQHLLAVRGRLLRRRQVLLQDPVHSEDPAAHRIEQVDALYTFPDAFMRIAPRLRRYLEMIFMPGEWSPRPLFLRGIYFTSSVRDGAALDAELAESLGVAVESLKDENRSWERERAYFLRDLFMNKVFREKGLVTRAANTIRLQRQRKLLVALAGIAAVAALVYFSWTGARQLNDSIGDQTRYWTAIDNGWKSRRADFNLIDRASAEGPWRYKGDRDLDLGEWRGPLCEFFDAATTQAEQPIRVPMIFRAQQVLRGDLSEGRRLVCRRLLESAVFAPAVSAARAQMLAIRPEAWPQGPGDAALVELVRLEVAQAGLTPPPRPESSAKLPLRIEPLMKFALPKEEFDRFANEQRASLRDAVERLYDKAAPGAAPDDQWPPPVLAADAESSRKAIDAGAKAMYDHYVPRVSGQHRPDLARVSESIKRFRYAEEAFLKSAEAATQQPASAESFAKYQKQWLDQLRAVEQRKLDVAEAMARLERDAPLKNSLAEEFETEADRAVAAAVAAAERLAQQIPKVSGAPAAAGASPSAAAAIRHLQALRQRLVETPDRLAKVRSDFLTDEMRAAVAVADQQYLSALAGPNGQSDRKYVILGQVYDLVRRQLEAAGAATTAAAADALDPAEAARQLDAVASGSAAGERLQQAAKTGKAVVEWAAKVRKGTAAAAVP